MPSNKPPFSCYVVGVLLVLYLFSGLFLVLAVHLNLSALFSTTPLLRAHMIATGFGVVGAAMAAMRKYYQALITNSTARTHGKALSSPAWDLGWIYYYLTRPLLGGVLGALSFTLSFIGFEVMAKAPSAELSDQGRYLLFALAFVAGFAVSHVLDRLNSIAKRTFAREQTKN